MTNPKSQAEETAQKQSLTIRQKNPLVQSIQAVIGHQNSLSLLQVLSEVNKNLK